MTETKEIYQTTLTVDDVMDNYQTIRHFTEELCEPLVTEDYQIQTMPDVSPTKWHIAHTSWFFETFVLQENYPDYDTPNPQYAYFYNSYYIAAGDRFFRPHRGLLARPTVKDVYQYRQHVDQHMLALLDKLPNEAVESLIPVIEIGLHHEQQHQELMVTDLKNVFAYNPLHPTYRAYKQSNAVDKVPALSWVDFAEGIHQIGHTGEGFAYDNEFPRHRVFTEPFQLASRLITNGEYMAFIEDGGYQRHDLWLSMGWDTVQNEGWDAPLYWQKRDGEWWLVTLAGLRKVDPNEPVCHVSYYEADAFARWAGTRLPTEAEWEIASAQVPIEGNFVDDRHYHTVPLPAGSNGGLQQMFGDVWEWTQSHYSPYPGYKPAPGALGEYNGKFMCNQFVLRGGSCATTKAHIRPTYRNFFPAHARWQFTGIRLLKDVR